MDPMGITAAEQWISPSLRPMFVSVGSSILPFRNSTLLQDLTNNCSSPGPASQFTVYLLSARPPPPPCHPFLSRLTLACLAALSSTTRLTCRSFRSAAAPSTRVHLRCNMQRGRRSGGGGSTVRRYSTFTVCQSHSLHSLSAAFFVIYDRPNILYSAMVSRRRTMDCGPVTAQFWHRAHRAP